MEEEEKKSISASIKSIHENMGKVPRWLPLIAWLIYAVALIGIGMVLGKVLEVF